LFIVDARAQQLEQFRDEYIQPCPNAATIKINFVATEHINCQFNEEICPHPGCGEKMLSGATSRSSHFKSCEYIPIQCPCYLLNSLTDEPASPLTKCNVTCNTSQELCEHIRFHSMYNDPPAYKVTKQGKKNQYKIEFIIPSIYLSRINLFHQYVVIEFGLRTLLVYFGAKHTAAKSGTVDLSVMELQREAVIQRLSRGIIPYKKKQLVTVQYRCTYSVVLESNVTGAYSISDIPIFGLDAYGPNANTITPISLGECLSVPINDTCIINQPMYSCIHTGTRT
jgi:hypothetical protein